MAMSIELDDDVAIVLYELFASRDVADYLNVDAVNRLVLQQFEEALTRVVRGRISDDQYVDTMRFARRRVSLKVYHGPHR